MLEVKNVVKKYGNHEAVRGVSFAVSENEVFGFVGPNGAGKSTTMNVITGYLAPTSGQVLVDGHDIVRDPIRAKRLIGYMPEFPPLYLDMTPEEELRFVAEAKGIPKSRISEEIERVIRECNVEEVRKRLIRTLSKGYRQRVGMAQAILGDPQIIVLDEPTSGLDPVQTIEFRKIITELGRDHTVIVSSHILPEVSEVCTKVMIIFQGKIITIDTPDNLAGRFGGDAGEMSLEDIFVKILKEQEGKK